MRQRWQPRFGPTFGHAMLGWRIGGAEWGATTILAPFYFSSISTDGMMAELGLLATGGTYLRVRPFLAPFSRCASRPTLVTEDGAADTSAESEGMLGRLTDSAVLEEGGTELGRWAMFS